MSKAIHNYGIMFTPTTGVINDRLKIQFWNRL